MIDPRTRHNFYGTGYGLIWPAKFLSGVWLWHFAKISKFLSGQSYGIFKNFANFYPDPTTASKGLSGVLVTFHQQFQSPLDAGLGNTEEEARTPEKG